jgi:hypothetical protein
LHKAVQSKPGETANGYGKEISRQQEDRTCNQEQLHQVEGRYQQACGKQSGSCPGWRRQGQSLETLVRRKRMTRQTLQKSKTWLNLVTGRCEKIDF